ncbi:MAG TPA: ATP-dependent helicase, partial [Ktedonobacteraceae bacterium]
AYDKYRLELKETNSTDFAHLQKWAYKLLKTPDTFQKIAGSIRYVLVDEYQDTNYIQEQILTLLASGSDTNNLVVIGDEDQAPYRFRGATVHNILTFTQQFPTCQKIHLTTNYRSQAEIIAACNRWIGDFDWSNGDGPRLRTEKLMQAAPPQRSDRALLRLEAVDMQDEAEQFADLVDSLKKQGRIEDYSDVALLLHSVRPWMSDPYIQACKEKAQLLRTSVQAVSLADKNRALRQVLQYYQQNQQELQRIHAAEFLVRVEAISIFCAGKLICL